MYGPYRGLYNEDIRMGYHLLLVPYSKGEFGENTHTPPPHTKPLTHRLLETFQIQITVNR